MQLQAPVVRRLDNAIHWIDLLLVDIAERLLDSKLSTGYGYRPSEQLVLDGFFFFFLTHLINESYFLAPTAYWKNILKNGTGHSY